MDIIAEDTFEIRSPDGHVDRVHVKFERPSQNRSDDGEWTCIAHVEGPTILGNRSQAEIRGASSLQALMLAVKFVHSLLTDEIERGAKIDELSSTFARSSHPESS